MGRAKLDKFSEHVIKYTRSLTLGISSNKRRVDTNAENPINVIQTKLIKLKQNTKLDKGLHQ